MPGPLRAVLGATLLSVAWLGCGAKKPPPPLEPQVVETSTDAGAEPVAEKPKSLFDRMGGLEAMQLIVDDFFARASVDPKLKTLFAKTTGPRLESFKKAMVDYLCEKTGGSCTYGGKSMKDAHKDLRISDDQWSLFIAHLSYALDANKVTENEKSDLFALLAPLKEEVVTKKAGKK